MWKGPDRACGAIVGRIGGMVVQRADNPWMYKQSDIGWLDLHGTFMAGFNTTSDHKEATLRVIQSQQPGLYCDDHVLTVRLPATDTSKPWSI